MRPIWVLKSVLLPIWIEVPAGRFEVRRITFGDLMDVNRVLARRKVPQIEVNIDPVRRFRKNGGSDPLSLSVLEIYSDAFALLCKGGAAGKKK